MTGAVTEQVRRRAEVITKQKLSYAHETKPSTWNCSKGASLFRESGIEKRGVSRR